MFWIIAAAVLAFMLAPILWIIPSPRQRLQAALRDRARALGVTVQITQLPQTRRQKVRKEETVNGLCYAMTLPKARAGERWRYWPDGAEDDVPGPPAAVQDRIAGLHDRLPKDTIVIEASGRMVKVFWREANADIAAVENLADILNTLVSD